MKRKSLSTVGIIMSILLLIGASSPVSAATDGGTLGVFADFNGQINEEMFYNGSSYDPDTDSVVVWWGSDDVTFTLWLNASNSRPGLAVDFIWTIWVDIENPASSYTIIGGDNSPRTDSPETVTINNVPQNAFQNKTLTIDCEGQTYNVWVMWQLTVKENGNIQDEKGGTWTFNYLI